MPARVHAVASSQNDIALEEDITEDIRASAHEGLRVVHAATSGGGCPPSRVPLRFQGNDRGFGNRLGWALTAAAVAEALNAPALLTYWPGGRKKVNGDGTRALHGASNAERTNAFPLLPRALVSLAHSKSSSPCIQSDPPFPAVGLVSVRLA